MKKIKIKICGYDPTDQFSYGNFILNILRKNFEIDLTEDPDYVFFNESNYDHLKYKDAVKIFFTGENVHPNFNLCDYAFGFDYLQFEDRYFRLPIFLVATFYNNNDLRNAGDLNFKEVIPFTKEDLDRKTEFCSFVYSNYLASGERSIFFDKLSKYKNINSGGKYLNNIGGPVKSKLEFELKHKFSIAFENSSRSGYTTEKICTSFSAKTIPIYFGDPKISLEFNSKRFINCHDYKNFDEVINRIKEIDNDDDLYIKMMNEPVLNNDFDFDSVRYNFELFLKNIFDQEKDEAKRVKINPIRQKALLQNESYISKIMKTKDFMRKILATIYKPFKRIKALEEFKIKIFRKKVAK